MQQQRQLRLGDILDDYCPRERRLANHTVVAMVGEAVRRTRCATCDTEHPYKGGKVPRQRKKSPVQAAYDEVLESVKKKSETPGVLVTRAVAEPIEEAKAAEASPGEPIPDAAPPADDVVRLHRPLIRASLPRVENAQPTARPIPEFTIRQAGRQGKFQNGRVARSTKGRSGAFNDQGSSRGPGGPGGGRHTGRPQGHGALSRPGQHQGKKRSR